MGWLFNETNTCYVTLGDDAVLSLPDGDWAITIWTKTASNAGTLWQYFLSWGALAANASLNMYVGETTCGTAADQDRAKATVGETAAGTVDLALTSSTAPAASASWIHWILERDGGFAKLYIDGSEVASIADTGFNGVNVAGNLYLGCRSDLDANRAFGGYTAELAKWDRALTATEKQQLSGTGGYSATAPNALADTTGLAVYLDMYDAFDCQVGGLTVTNNGDNATASSSEHPVSYGAGGLSIPVAMSQYARLRRVM